MKKLLFLLFVVISVFANNCNDKFFSYSNSINKNERMSVKEFLTLLVTQKCGINIVYDDAVSKEKIKRKMPFVKIKHYSLNQILDLLLSKNDMFYTLNNNLLEISFYKTKTYKLDFIISSRNGASNLNATNSNITNTYSFNFWSKIKSNIDTILKNTSLYYKPPVIDKAAGLITVTGTKKQIEEIDKYMKNVIDRLTKEVLIDVKIYSVALSNSHSTGIDWSSFSMGMNSGSKPVEARYLGGAESVFNSSYFNIAGFLDFLARNGNVNSLSNPKIVTLNNQKAVISVGDTIYFKYASSVVNNPNAAPSTQYTIDSKFVGVVLDITPQINDRGDIILSIAPRISSFKDVSQLTSNTRSMPPDTSDNTMLSVVKLKDNETLVLGGLITKNEALSVKGVSVLKEIPIIKYLFSSKDKVTSKRELVFVITPHIIDLNRKKTLRDLGFGRIK